MNPTRCRSSISHAAILAAVIATMSVAGCSDGDEQGQDREPGDSATTVGTSDTTQPPASDEEAAFAIVEDMVIEATGLVDDLFQDPTAVDDEQDDRLDRLGELYTDDSPTPPAVETQLRQLVEDGQRWRPAASGVFRDLGVYQPVVVDDDTVRFRICASEDRETIDADGTVVERVAQVSQGTGEARRIDGIWRFYGIHPEEDRTLPLEPGTANAGFCDNLYAEVEGDA